MLISILTVMKVRSSDNSEASLKEEELQKESQTEEVTILSDDDDRREMKQLGLDRVVTRGWLRKALPQREAKKRKLMIPKMTTTVI